MSEGRLPAGIEVGKGSPYWAVLVLAMPTVIAMLSQSAVNEIDVVFFSHLPCPDSSNAQAALLPSLIVTWLFGGSLSAVSVGTQALTARRFAEGNLKAAGQVLANGAWFCLVAGLVGSVVGLALLPQILGLMIKVPEVRDIAVSYTRWRLMGIISMAMTMAIKSFFDGVGKTYIHLVSALVMNAFNVLLCWMFIFGNLGVRAMGASGAGFAAFVSTWIGLFIMLVYAWLVRDDYDPVRWSNISRKLTWDILKLSVPAAIATITLMIGFGTFTSIVNKLDTLEASRQVVGQCGGVEAVNGAATTDIVAILKLTLTACIAFGTATATLVGQSLGAKNPDAASRYGWASIRLGALIFGVIGIAEGVVFTPQIIAFITQSEAVREAATLPLRVMGIVTPVMAVAMIMSEALFGAGNTKFVALAQLTLVFGVLVPLAYVLGIVLHVGLMGIWVSACVYATLAALTMCLKFHGGAWKDIHL